jgi:acyl-CoA synthetase (AMP-forming)/AMP-acid ligase II
VAKYKRLEGGIEFVGEIPKSSAGKILRKDLKAAYVASRKVNA